MAEIMLCGNTLSVARQRNYEVEKLGGGQSGVAFLMFPKAAWRTARQTLPPSKVNVATGAVATKCQRMTYNDIQWDVQFMQGPTYQQLVQNNMTCGLVNHDPNNLKWCESSYEGPTLEAFCAKIEEQNKAMPLNFAWTILHDLLKIIYYMRHGVTSPRVPKPRSWSPIMHGDMQASNVCIRKRDRQCRVKLIDWGRGKMRGVIAPDGIILSNYQMRQELARWASLAHRLLHGPELSYVTMRCKCKPDQNNPQYRIFSARSSAERRQITAFITSVAHRVTHQRNDSRGGNQYTLDKALKIMEDPAAWCKKVKVPKIKPVKTMPRYLNDAYAQVNWDDRALQKAIESEYKRLG